MPKTIKKNIDLGGTHSNIPWESEGVSIKELLNEEDKNAESLKTRVDNTNLSLAYLSMLISCHMPM